MSEKTISLPVDGVPEAVRQLEEAATAKKCWGCGCLHGSLDAIEQSVPEQERPATLQEALDHARAKTVEKKYDCLGCEVCYPPLAMNALEIGAEACPQDEVEARQGWPPLPGAYTVVRYHAPVAVCTLTDDSLSQTLVSDRGIGSSHQIAIAGLLYTENLGIERVIQNVLGNPNIRFLILCGPDSKQKIGHLPGQSLLALARNGLDEHGRINGAEGKRPMLKNLDPAAVEHFRESVEVVDLIGEANADAVVHAASECASRNPGPAQPFTAERSVDVMTGYIPERMVSDRAGYFVVYPDRERSLLVLEHYRNDGVLDLVIEGREPAELYIPAVERELISRLDHAAYLGRELARAEQAMRDGGAYIQDAAPEQASHGCGCGSTCG